MAIRKRLLADVHVIGRIEGLDLGQEYEVQAVEAWSDGYLRFYVHVLSLPWPSPYPAELFEISDPTIPENWSGKFKATNLGVRFRRLAFKQWAEDETFYERLLNGDDAAVSAYASRKRQQ